jgi:hypothetical protein
MKIKAFKNTYSLFKNFNSIFFIFNKNPVKIYIPPAIIKKNFENY